MLDEQNRWPAKSILSIIVKKNPTCFTNSVVVALTIVNCNNHKLVHYLNEWILFLQRNYNEETKCWIIP